MEKKFTFYDSHPGLAGATARLPEPMKKAVDELNGKTASLDEIMSKLQPIAKELEGELIADEEEKYITFTIHREKLIHSYKLISYK